MTDESRFWLALAVATISAGALGYWSGLQNRMLASESADRLLLQKDVEKLQKLRQDERQGRIAAERQLRLQKQEQQSVDGMNFSIIGRIDSPFPDRRGTPRQPLLVPAARAFIRFDKKKIQRAHFEELSQFSHVWVLFVFHENTNLASGQDKQQQRAKSSSPAVKMAKIRPPRLGGQKVGCLSTRSPHRPNEIGLSVCEVVGLGDDYLELRGVDMVSGTPILDIKPYIPYDVVPSEYVLPMSLAADGSPLPLCQLRVPDWIVESDIQMRGVSFSEEALQGLTHAIDSNLLRFCRSTEEALEFITQVLRQDVRGVRQGRGTCQENEIESQENPTPITTFHCRLDTLDIEFVTRDSAIEVIRIILATGVC